MFTTAIRVAENLHEINQRKFVPRFYKDKQFRKHMKNFIKTASIVLQNRIIDYDTIVDLLRFYVDTHEYVMKYNRVLPIHMISGIDVISIIYNNGNLKCNMRYNIDSNIDVTMVYTYQDDENPLIKKQEKSFNSYPSRTIPGHIKVWLVYQVIKYITLYMTLVYEYGVEENETNIHEDRQ